MSAARKRLLFIHTGGTLGMDGDPGPLAPSAYSNDVLRFVPGLEELVEIESVFVSNIDSSDMTAGHWEAIAGQVAGHLDDYDGFVVLHGTDTMAFSASACSYLLENLPKPVVFTGSQRPIAQLRSDARQNLIHAALCATLDLPEVSLCFNEALTRGNRTTKVSVSSYEAYASPQLPPLMRLGTDMKPGTPPRRPSGPFRLRQGFDRRVTVLTLYPGAHPLPLQQAVDSGARAVILQAFGAGNLPLQDWPEAIAQATQAGVHVIVGSQCLEGRVELGRYAGSQAAKEAGALSARDMTLEATLTRAMYLLAQEGDFRDAWRLDLAGEVTLG